MERNEKLKDFRTKGRREAGKIIIAIFYAFLLHKVFLMLSFSLQSSSALHQLRQRYCRDEKKNHRYIKGDDPHFNLILPRGNLTVATS